MKKYLIFLAIIVVGIGGYFLLHSNKVAKVVPPQVLTLEQIVQRDNDALVNKDYDLLWGDMHPDDKARWSDKNEYVQYLKRINSTTQYQSITTKEITDVTEWTHPVTGAKYQNVKRVDNSVTLKNQTEPADSPYIYAKSGNRWYFFSQVFSSGDRERLKSQASPGPSYKELSKNPNKFVNTKAKYTGKITQIQEDESGSGFLKLAVTNAGSGYWNDEIYVNYSTSTEYFEGDVVTVYGILTGAITYTSVSNYQITLPSMAAVAIEKPVVVTPKKYYKSIGETIKIGVYNLTVDSYGECAYEFPDEFRSEKTIAFNMTQTNTGSAPVRYNMYDFLLIDNLGNTYSPTAIFCPGTILVGSSITPGEKLQGYMGFEIPDYVKPTVLEINPVTLGSKDFYIIDLQ